MKSSRYIEGFDLQAIKAQEKEQEKKAREIIDVLSNKIVNISNYTQDGRKYYNEELVKPYYEAIKQGFEFEFFRRSLIPFRFEDEGEIYRLAFPHFITNIIMWSPLTKLDPSHIDASCLIDAANISSGSIKAFIDNKIIIPFTGTVDNRTLNAIIHDMRFELARISRDFNPIMGMSMNAETFIDLANRYPRFDEILHTKLSEEMQPAEIEEYLAKLTDEQVQIIINDDKDNMLKALFLSGTGIKKDQFKEFAVNGGWTIQPLHVVMRVA